MTPDAGLLAGPVIGVGVAGVDLDEQLLRLGIFAEATADDGGGGGCLGGGSKSARSKECGACRDWKQPSPLNARL